MITQKKSLIFELKVSDKIFYYVFRYLIIYTNLYIHMKFIDNFK